MVAIFGLPKRIRLYVKVSTDRMEIQRLDTGQSITEDAKVPFSNSRIVLAHFMEAEDHLKALIRGLGIGGKMFSPNLEFVVQQMERTQDGLSSVERRALVDACEHAGGIMVKVVEHERPLGMDEALKYLECPK